jgi:hypothetical protein
MKAMRVFFVLRPFHSLSPQHAARGAVRAAQGADPQILSEIRKPA